MNRSIVIMTAFFVCIFCKVTKANEYNQTFLHLLALPSCFITEDACRPYGMSTADVSSLSYSYAWKNDDHVDLAFKLDTMTVEDIALLVHAQKIDINQRDFFGATALHYASMAHPRMFDWLLTNGASPYLVDNTGWNILHYAVASGRLDWTWDEGSLINTYVDLTKLVNQQDENGNTPLHTAVYCDEHSGKKLLLIIGCLRDNCVRWLLEHGADTSIRNDEGYTPADCAKMNYGSLSYGKHLLELMEAKTN